jgi:hypothetical protein
VFGNLAGAFHVRNLVTLVVRMKQTFRRHYNCVFC